MARILQVCNTDFYLSRFLAPLIVELIGRGHEVDCVCEGQSILLDRIPDQVRVHEMPFPRRASARGFGHSIQRLRRIIRRGSYDCVDSHNRNASIAGRTAAWLERVPVNIYTAHGFYFHDDQSAIARGATIALEAVLARITDFTLSQSREDVELMLSRRLISETKILHIGNGIDVDRFSASRGRHVLEQQLSLGHDRFRVGTTGRLVRGKGHLDLLHAFSELRASKPNAELVIVGGAIPQDISPFEAEFVAEANSLGVRDHVVLTGIVDDVERYLETMDVFVLPSYREGLPRSVLEAMSMGLPVVASDIRGNREAIEDGHSGMLYPARDVHALLSKLRTLARNPDLRASLGRDARRRARALFDERKYVAVQADAIERLLDGVPGAACEKAVACS